MESIPHFGGRLARHVPGVAASPPPVRLTWIFDTWRPVSVALTSHKITLCGSDSGQQLRLCGGGEAQSSFQNQQQQQQQTLDRRERLRKGFFPQMLLVSHSLFMSSHQSGGQHSIAKLGASFEKKKHCHRTLGWIERLRGPLLSGANSLETPNTPKWIRFIMFHPSVKLVKFMHKLTQGLWSESLKGFPGYFIKFVSIPRQGIGRVKGGKRVKVEVQRERWREVWALTSHFSQAAHSLRLPAASLLPSPPDKKLRKLVSSTHFPSLSLSPLPALSLSLYVTADVTIPAAFWTA